MTVIHHGEAPPPRARTAAPAGSESTTRRAAAREGPSYSGGEPPGLAAERWAVLVRRRLPRAEMMKHQSAVMSVCAVTSV